MLEHAVHAELGTMTGINLNESADTCGLIVDQCIGLADCILDRRTTAPWPPAEKVIRWNGREKPEVPAGPAVPPPRRSGRCPSLVSGTHAWFHVHRTASAQPHAGQAAWCCPKTRQR